MPTIRIKDDIWERLEKFEVLETARNGRAFDRKAIAEREIERYMSENIKEAEKALRETKKL
jgi:hypothetical protein